MQLCNEVRRGKQPHILLFPLNNARALDGRMENLQQKNISNHRTRHSGHYLNGIQKRQMTVNMGVYKQELATSRLIKTAPESQERIGWDHFMMGRIAKPWKSVGPTEGNRTNPENWARSIALITL